MSICKRILPALALLIVAALALSFHSQGASTGSLSGKVQDDGDGEPVEDATITCSIGGRTIDTDDTDRDGKYSISGLPAGDVNVSVFASFYAMQNFTVVITPGNNTVKDVRLKGVAYISVYAQKYGSYGEPIPGALVKVGKYSGYTNAIGQAYLEVEYGSYTVEVSAKGYQTYTYNLGNVGKGYEATLKVPLKKAGADGGNLLLIVMVVVILAVVAAGGAGGYMYMRKKKARPAAGAPAAAQIAAAPPPPGPGPEKQAEWDSYRKMYGKPHPESPEGKMAAAPAPAAPPQEPPATGGPPAQPPG